MAIWAMPILVQELEYQKAIDHYKTGLEISTAIGDRSGMQG
jgi:hypothetical protein